MPDTNNQATGAGGPISPNAILNIFYAACFLSAVGAISLYVYHYSGKDFSISGFNEARVAVGSSDMLGIELTLSGISIPLAISYLLNRSKELQVSIFDLTIYHLERNGVGREEFNQAQAVYDDGSNPLRPSDAFNAIGEVLKLGSPESEDGVSDSCLNWIISHRQLQAGFKQLFVNNDDRRLVSTCIKSVAIPAIFLIIDLYLRFAGVRGWWIDLIEIILLVICACANLLMYYVLVHIVKIKTDLRQQTRQEVPKACSVCGGEIKTALMHIKRISELVSSEVSNTSSKLDAALQGMAEKT